MHHFHFIRYPESPVFSTESGDQRGERFKILIDVRCVAPSFLFAQFPAEDFVRVLLLEISDDSIFRLKKSTYVGGALLFEEVAQTSSLAVTNPLVSPRDCRIMSFAISPTCALEDKCDLRKPAEGISVRHAASPCEWISTGQCK